MKNKSKTILRYAVLLLLIGGIIVCILLINNQFHSDYEDLDNTDQYVLNEWNTYYSSTESKDIWKDFHLRDKSILALKNSFGSGYLINPQTEIHSIFAKKIHMPSDFSIEVYRISFIAPQLFSFRFDGNFNSIDKNYRLYRNDVYYTKYNQEDSVSSQFSSSHYITFLNHEAFHYYMQSAWPEGITYSADMLSNEDLSSLYDEYKILNQIQTALLEEDVKPETLLPYAKEYVQIVENRMEQNPEYVKKELARETMEGTATYVGIQASKIAGYDFGVMYFDNIKNVPFSDLQRTIEAGSYNKQNLADRIPYETGALLCLLMDALEVPDWQETLNQQTKENPITLFSILSDFTKEL